MRKVAAILLIVLFLFNLVGYRIMFAFSLQFADQKMEAALDGSNYNEADLVTISVPLSLPYLDDQTDFERVDGELNYNGRLLKYVKRKFSDGKLVLLCLPDDNKMKLQSAKEDFFKASNDLAQNDASKKTGQSKPNIFKIQLFDLISYFSAQAPNLSLSSTSYSGQRQQSRLPASHRNSPEQPPDFL